MVWPKTPSRSRKTFTHQFPRPMVEQIMGRLCVYGGFKIDEQVTIHRESRILPDTS